MGVFHESKFGGIVYDGLWKAIGISSRRMCYFECAMVARVEICVGKGG